MSETQVKSKVTKSNFVVLKTKEFSLFNGMSHNPTAVVMLFNKKWSGLKCMTDDLVKNAVLEEADGKLTITGDRVVFYPSFGKTWYGKRYELQDEYREKTALTKFDMLRAVKYWSIGKLELSESDIKIGYSSFWNWVRRRRTYYLDTTADVISKLSHVALHEIKEKNGKFYTEGWYETTVTSRYHIEITNYRLDRSHG